MKSAIGGPHENLKGGEVAVMRGKDGRFRVTIPKDLALVLDFKGEREDPCFCASLQPSGSLPGDHPEAKEDGRS